MADQHSSTNKSHHSTTPFLNSPNPFLDCTNPYLDPFLQPAPAHSNTGTLNPSAGLEGNTEGVNVGNRRSQSAARQAYSDEHFIDEAYN